MFLSVFLTIPSRQESKLIENAHSGGSAHDRRELLAPFEWVYSFPHISATLQRKLVLALQCVRHLRVTCKA